jgi:hypothetical protein
MIAICAQAMDPPRVYPIRRDAGERGEVPAYVLVNGSNSFSFVPPTGWTPEGRLSKNQVLFVSPELDASLSFQIIPMQAETNGVMQPKRFEEQVAERMPTATVIGTFPCVVANRKGLGLDFEESAADNKKLLIRAAWIPIQSGVAEFTFRAPKKRMQELRLVFGRFLASVSEEKKYPARK